MCGISGMVDWRAATLAEALRSAGEAMTETLRHLESDAGTVWVEAEGGLALGWRRLAITDLSRGGAQPMHPADGRFELFRGGRGRQPRHFWRPALARSAGVLLLYRLVAVAEEARSAIWRVRHLARFRAYVGRSR